MAAASRPGRPAPGPGVVRAATARSEAEVERTAVFESALDAIVSMDHEGRITEFNPAAEVMFGWSRADVLGRPLAEVLVPARLRGAHEGGLRHYLATGTTAVVGKLVEVPAQRRDGSEVPVELSVTAIHLDGRPPRFTAFIRDVTERARSHRALEEARTAAEESARVKAQFLANMSHEIRTPLNAIVGLTSLLLDGPLEGEARDHVRAIRSSSDHLLGIISEILDFSKLEAGGLELEQAVLEPAVVAAGAIDLVARAAEAKGLEIGWVVDDGVPEAVLGDPGRVRQVLANLLSNAVKFTDQGQVWLRVATEPAPFPTLRLSVRDTGIGIPRQSQSRLFEPFVQGDPSISRVYGGTGLGLAISRFLVERMGGRIDVESDVGCGSTFSFTLPAPVLSAAPATTGSPPGGAKAAGETIDADMARRHPLRILLAEDNPTNQMVAVGLLRRLGYEIDVVADGRAAVAAVRGGSYDMVLMDIQMPVMDGTQAATEILAGAADGAPRPHLVAVTANATEEDRRACFAIGFDDYLAKPVTVPNLVASLKRAASRT